MHEAGLESFYVRAKDSEFSLKGVDTRDAKGSFDYLDDPDTRASLLKLDTSSSASVVFLLPAIHCSACIYLLESLPVLLGGIRESRIDFLNKKCTVLFDPNTIKLSEIALFLTKIGYKPDISLGGSEDSQKSAQKKRLSSLYLKIGVAFFCFGNIMMLALPEYLSNSGGLDEEILGFISDIQLYLGIPLLYALSGYLKSAWGSIRAKKINLDVPISIGILSLFLRSIYEIVSETGPGYMDSLAGLAFFLLVGRLFQEKTYQGLSFSRDHASFFPLSAQRVIKDKTESIPVKNIGEGDILSFRNGEILPIECTLLSQSASIDYSFVTGEAEPEEVSNGEMMFTGGRVVGSSVKAVANSDFDQAYLNSLWNRADKQENITEGTGLSVISDTVSKWFTIVILSIAAISFFYWYIMGSGEAFSIVAAILIVACPCALALTIPFTYGTVMRLLGKKGLYLRSDIVIERMADIGTVVFDKTGTLTYTALETDGTINWSGNPDSKKKNYLINIINTAAGESSHPVSRAIKKATEDDQSTKSYHSILSTEELPGKGISVVVQAKTQAGGHDNISVDIGSAEWIISRYPESGVQNFSFKNHRASVSGTYISVNGRIVANFEAANKWRPGLKGIFDNLKMNGYSISVLSGDNDTDAEALSNTGLDRESMNFNMKPEGKADHIRGLKSRSDNGVLMAGDGLNDISALSIADVGIAVTEDTGNFTPSSDGILLGEKLDLLRKALILSKKARKTVYLSMGVSFLYNIVGLSFAVAGNLTPVAAAILMPISSVTIVLITTGKSIFDEKITT